MKKVSKQVSDQIVWKQVEDTAQGLLWNGSKTFAIPIVTESGL